VALAKIILCFRNAEIFPKLFIFIFFQKRKKNSEEKMKE
jgi:hypothetical protein